MSAIVKSVTVTRLANGDVTVSVVDADDVETKQTIVRAPDGAGDAESRAIAKQVKQSSTAKSVIRDPKGATVTDDGISLTGVKLPQS